MKEMRFRVLRRNVDMYFAILPVSVSVIAGLVYLFLRQPWICNKGIPGWAAWLSVISLPFLIYGIAILANHLQNKKSGRKADEVYLTFSTSKMKSEGKVICASLLCLSGIALIASGVCTALTEHSSYQSFSLYIADACLFGLFLLGLFVAAVISSNQGVLTVVSTKSSSSVTGSPEGKPESGKPGSAYVPAFAKVSGGTPGTGLSASDLEGVQGGTDLRGVHAV